MTRKDKFRYLRALGRRVRKLRIERGLKRKDAEVVGIDPSNLDKIEKGKRGHMITILPRLAKFLGVHQSVITDFPFEYDEDPVKGRR